MELDPTDARLALPFDQYQRYDVAARLLAELGVEAGARVLDVGGAPGFVELFLPDHRLAVLDRAGDHEGRYILGDGARLPFADQLFDAVVSLDTLEHVPRADRASFLDEIRRVSRDVVVLSAPFDDPMVELAEDALNDFVRARFGTFDTLDEHREHGLPDLDETIDRLKGDGWSLTVLPSGYLPHWLGAMLVHHELLASGLPWLERLHAFYNATVSPSDARAPSYRKVIVASRGRSVEELLEPVAMVTSAGDPEAGVAALQSMASAVLSTRLSAVVANSESARSLEEAKRRIDDLERQLVDREAHLLEVQAELARVRLERDDTVRRNDDVVNQVDRRLTQMHEDIRDMGVTGLARRLKNRIRGQTGGPQQ